MGDKAASDKLLKKEMDKDYPLVRMSDITDEARLIAVAWVEGYERQGLDIPGKQKLASDIMNYARRNAIKIVNDVCNDTEITIEVAEFCEKLINKFKQNQ